jgi:hypothetical protein
MIDSALSRRLGRRMNHVLVDRSLFAWIHRIFGTMAGCVCVFSAIITETIVAHYWQTGTWRRGFSSLSAFFFAVAAMPFVVSYYFNIDKVGASISRTALFALTLALSSVGVDAYTFGIFRDGASPTMLAMLYIGQAMAYVLIGQFVLGHGLRSGSADQ